MHSMLVGSQPEMPHLAYGLTGKKLEDAAAKILSTDEPGLTVSTIGGAKGPTWPANGVHSLDFLEHFPGLKHLSVNLPELTSLEPLRHVQETLETFHIGGFLKPSKASLAPLGECRRLKSLSLTRMPKDVGVVWDLPKLEELSFTGYRDVELRPTGVLKKLRSLYLGFGGMTSIQLVEQMPNLAAVEILRTKGLGDLSSLSGLTKLQYIALGDLPQVEEFPDCSRLRKLRRVYLDTMNGLKDLGGLLSAPALEDLILINSKVQPAVVLPLVEHRKLKRATIGLASRKAEQEVEEAFGERAMSVFGTEWQSFELR